MRPLSSSTPQRRDDVSIALDRLQAIYALADSISRAASLEQIFEAALTGIQASLGADRASILLFDADGVMRFRAWRGLSDAYRCAVEGHSPWTIGERAPRPIVVEDVFADPSWTSYRPVFEREGVRSLGFIPLVFGERLLGKFMIYFDAPHAYGDDEIKLAQVLGNHIAFAVERKRTTDSVALYREIFKHSTEAIGIIDPSGRYLEQNAAHRALVGYEDDEITGKTPAIHFGQAAFEQIAATLATTGAFRGELVSQGKGGRRRDLELSAFTVRNDAGDPLCLVGIKRDVTERKRYEERLRMLANASARLSGSLDVRATLHALAEVAVPVLADWTLAELSERGTDEPAIRTHHHADREAGALLAKALAERTVSSPRPGCEIVCETDPSRFEAVFGAEDARLLRELRASSCVVAPLKARGKTLGRVLLARTDGRKHLPEDIATVQELVGNAGLAIDNAQLFHATQESDRRKDEFLAMLAHELRNPLAPMQTALDLLKREPQGEAPGKGLTVLERQMSSLTRIVDDLLDVSRVTRGKIELRITRMDVTLAVKRALESSRPVIESRRHEVTVSVPPAPLFVNADAVRLEQILVNLLVNAAKYTDAGGRISVSATEARGAVELRVRDNGVGMSTELIARVFNLFEQGGRDLSRAEGGLGIGLTIVRKLVELHGGTVVARSEGPGKGSELVVTLPSAPAVVAVEAPASAPSTPEPRVGGARKRRVLIVDDNVDAATMLAELVEMYGHEVTTALDGRSALTLAAEWKPEIVFLDIGLPEMDGYAVAAEMRRRIPDCPPLVALTGYSDRERTRAAGFTHHVIKPASVETIADILATVSK